MKSLFTDNLSAKKISKNLQTTKTNKFLKVVRYKFDIQKSIVLLFISNKEFKNLKAPLIIA